MKELAADNKGFNPPNFSLTFFKEKLWSFWPEKIVAFQ